MPHLTPVPNDPEQLRDWLLQLGEQDPQTFVQALLRAGTAAQQPFDPFGNAEVDLPDPPKDVSHLTIKVSLKGARPPIWRRLVVAGDTTLDDLHDILQAAMGWSGSHLHRFYPAEDDHGPYFVTDDDLEEGEEGTPEASVRTDQVLREPGDRITYDYDFGDGWTHDVRLEKVAEASDEPVPRCTGGAKACPPEDVGGIHGYAEVAAWHRAGRPADAVPAPFEDLEQIVDWLPVEFDPDAFDVEDVNLQLTATAMAGQLVEQLRPDVAAVVARLDDAGAGLATSLLARADRGRLSEDELREATRHWQVLLDVVGAGVELTAAGHLPPAVVQQVFDRLGLGESWIGKGNREDLTPPVAGLRRAAQDLGLLRKTRRRLAPTSTARAASGDPAALMAHVASRLPCGRRQIEREAGVFALVVLAGGAGEVDVHREVALLLTSRGWRMENGTPLDRYHALGFTRQVLSALLGPTATYPDRDLPPWAARAAASVLFAG